jgi:hypothetical protein
MKLIADWKKFHRMWSVRLSAIVTAIWAYLLASPETMLAVLNQIPADMRAWLPSFVPVALFVLVMLARITHQEKISGPK